MKAFSSLFAKILFWLFLNLAIIAVVLVGFFGFQSQMDLNAFFGRQTLDRMRVAGRLIAYDLSQTGRESWADVLTRHSQIHQVNFALVLGDGSWFLSREMDVPEMVQRQVLTAFRLKPPPAGLPPASFSDDDRGRKQMPPPADPPGMTNPGVGGEQPDPSDDRHAKRPRLMMRTKNPTRYWARILIRVSGGSPHRRPPAMLLAVSDSITGRGFFFDPLPWIIVAAAVLFISVLLWIPLVRNITRPIVRMTRAAEEITRGKFDVRINESRADEIGRLGSAINHMTLRLSAYMKGQKRFLGDVAHELGSPIARIQFGLGILEQHAGTDNQKRVTDVMEDVTHMSNLVNELLSFSRADMSPSKVALAATELSPIVKRAVQREGTPATEIVMKIDPMARVLADPELLARALANLVRNAVRYAGSAGPILITANKQRGHMTIEIKDCGPGVPENLLGQLFEPFYRLDPSRDRNSGGVGLGLAIVKTCIEACRGTVSARNLEPAGFAVTITLTAY